MIPYQPINVSSQTKPRRRHRVNEYLLNDEAVLYDVAYHATHYLNITACFIWSKCDGRRTVEDIAERVLDEFEMNDPTRRATVTKDVQAAITELAQNGLVDVAPTPSPIKEPPASARTDKRVDNISKISTPRKAPQPEKVT